MGVIPNPPEADEGPRTDAVGFPWPRIIQGPIVRSLASLAMANRAHAACW
jgi:hypothetical protein